MRRFAVFFGVLLLAFTALPAPAADWVNNLINATQTSQTITFDDCMSSVWVKNTGSTNEVFICLFRNGETAVACTSSTGRQLDPGEARTWTLGARPNQCWKAVSIICSTGETTTVRGDSLP